MKVSEAIERYLRTKQGKPANTQRSISQTLTQFAWHLRDADLAEWEDDVDLAAAAVRQSREIFALKSRAIGTLNLRRTHVKSFLDYCQGRGWIVLSATQILNESGWECLKEVNKSVQRKRIPVHQLAEILDTQTDPRRRVLLAVAVNTGFRASEIVGQRVTTHDELWHETTGHSKKNCTGVSEKCHTEVRHGLRVGDVDLENSTINVYRIKTGLFQKIGINSDLVAELYQWLTVYASQLQAQGIALHPQHMLVPSRLRWSEQGWSGELDINPEVGFYGPEDVVYDALARLGIKVTLGDREGIHTLRRSFGLAMYHEIRETDGRDEALRIVAELLGHANTITTERYLGVQDAQEKANRHVQGKPFLSKYRTPAGENVTPLRAIN